MQKAERNFIPSRAAHPAARTVVIADDLSGAAECASEFATQGLPTELELAQTGGPRDGGVLVWDLDAREVMQPLSPDVIRALQQARRGFVKVDSLLRGRWADLVAAAVSGAGLPAVMCTALPRLGRAMREGCVDLLPPHPGESESPPVEYCRASAIQKLAALGIRAGHLVPGSGDSLRDALLRGVRTQAVTVVDARSEQDLLHLAEALESLGFPYLAVGSAGLAGALARSLGVPAWECVAPALPQRRTVLVGSLTLRAREQLNRLTLASGQPVRWWEPVRGMAPLAPSSAGQDPLQVYATGVPAAQGQGGRALTDAFVKAVLADLPPVNCFVATGGETARALCDALGASRMLVLGQVEQGVSLARVTLATNDVHLILKSGSFGDTDTLLRMARLGHASMNEREA